MIPRRWLAFEPISHYPWAMLKLVSSALVLILAAAPALAQVAVPQPGHYCLRTPIGGGEGEEDEQEALNFVADDANADPDKVGENELRGPVRLGLLGVDVDIERREGQIYIGFSNYMPDNGQIVRAAPALARPGPNNALEFTFTDNWLTPGLGVVKADGAAIILEITRTGEAQTFAGRYADRQFGEFRLNPGTCPAYR